MAAAWVLTLLALCGVLAGAYLGESRALSSHLAAAGGGLLFGIALFWLMPEVADTSGWKMAVLFALVATATLAVVDNILVHSGFSPRHGVLGPLLIATAMHGFLDGWSVRTVSVDRLARTAVLIGLALHKVPEGLALGWVARRSLSPAWQAALAGGAVEAFTLAGAIVQPEANRTGSQWFGPWWTAVMLSIIAGSFLFLGSHAVLPARKRTGVMAVFLATFLFVGGAAFVRSRLAPV